MKAHTAYPGLVGFALVVVVASASACGPTAPPDAGDPGDGGGDGEGDAGSDGGVLSGVTRLDDRSDALALAGEGGGVKYLLPVEGAEPREPILDCAFQNTALYPFHIQYLNELEGGEDIAYLDYIQLVLQRATRAWWGGEVAWRPTLIHPLTAAPGVLVFSLYTEDSPGNRMVADDVREVFTALEACAPAFEGTLAFAAVSNEQRQTANMIRATLAAEGIAILDSP